LARSTVLMQGSGEEWAMPALRATFQPSAQQLQAIAARNERLAQAQAQLQPIASSVKPERSTIGAQVLQLQPAGRPPLPTAYSLEQVEAMNAAYLQQQHPGQCAATSMYRCQASAGLHQPPNALVSAHSSHIHTTFACGATHIHVFVECCRSNYTIAGQWCTWHWLRATAAAWC
jgi:hypothetical protein